MYVLLSTYRFTIYINQLIEQKGMTFDHDFDCLFPLFSSLLENRGKKKRKINSKVVVKSYAFLLDLTNSIPSPLSDYTT